MLQKCKVLSKDLRNILLCKAYRLTGRLRYPHQILPRKKFKTAIDFDNLLSNSSVLLVRRFNKNSDELFDTIGGTRILKSKALEPKEIGKGLSLNLYGSKFKDKYLKYRVLVGTSGGATWRGEKVYLVDHLKGITVEDGTCTPVYFDAKNIHNQDVPYNRSHDKTIGREVETFFASINKHVPILNEGKYKLKGQSKIEHDPIVLNYWHVQFFVYDYKRERIPTKGSSAWYTSICESALTNLLCLNAYSSLSDIKVDYKIDKMTYRV